MAKTGGSLGYSSTYNSRILCHHRSHARTTYTPALKLSRKEHVRAKSDCCANYYGRLTVRIAAYASAEQFYMQGRAHYELHSWWHRPMRRLQDLWARLEARTLQRCQQLQELAVSAAQTPPSASEELNNALAASVLLVGALIKRQRLRQLWDQRAKDPILLSGRCVI